MSTIKREIPEALFVHVVRDGRDAALSLKKQHVVPPRLWPRERALFAWALLWQWTVRKGRRFGQSFPADYIEVRYEELVRHPEKTFTTLGEFLDHDLDYGRIQKTPSGGWRLRTRSGKRNPARVLVRSTGGKPNCLSRRLLRWKR
jgi:hypothetical protein